MFVIEAILLHTWQRRPFLMSSSSQMLGANDLVSLSYMSGNLESSLNLAICRYSQIKQLGTLTAKFGGMRSRDIF